MGVGESLRGADRGAETRPRGRESQIRKDHEAEYKALVEEYRNDIEKKHSASKEIEELRAEMESRVQNLKRELELRVASENQAYNDVKFIGENLQLAMLKLSEHQYNSGSLAGSLLEALQTPPLNSAFSNINQGDGTPDQDQRNSSNANGKA